MQILRIDRNTWRTDGRTFSEDGGGCIMQQLCVARGTWDTLKTQDMSIYANWVLATGLPKAVVREAVTINDGPSFIEGRSRTRAEREVALTTLLAKHDVLVEFYDGLTKPVAPLQAWDAPAGTMKVALTAGLLHD